MDEGASNYVHWISLIFHGNNNMAWGDMIIGNDNTRGRGRLKLTLDVIVKNNLIEMNLSKYLALDRIQWRKMIYVADSNWLGLRLGLVWFGDVLEAYIGINVLSLTHPPTQTDTHSHVHTQALNLYYVLSWVNMLMAQESLT